MKLSRRGLFGFAAGAAVAPAALASTAPNWWRTSATELIALAPGPAAEWRGSTLVRWSYPLPMNWEVAGYGFEAAPVRRLRRNSDFQTLP